MVERRTIENWGAHLNVEGEPLTIEQAMLLHLGHLNGRLQAMLTDLSDMRRRLERIEIFLARINPEYDEYARTELHQALAERYAYTVNGTTTPARRG